jgi:protocatechuate 3,4-dioxygenase beta subunit
LYRRLRWTEGSNGMGNRRDVLLGVGATLGVAAFSISRVNRYHDEILLWEGADMRAPVASLEPGTSYRCTPGLLTEEQTEGPFYTPRTPRRRDIRDEGVRAPALVLAGRALDSRCQPIAGAVLDFWQTDHTGNYDQHGYRYRGHQITDQHGRFELITVRPMAYFAMSTFRTPHIHVKLKGPATPLLTTQLYLPDAVDTNARDFLYMPSLCVALMDRDATEEHAVFDFVLADV